MKGKHDPHFDTTRFTPVHKSPRKLKRNVMATRLAAYLKDSNETKREMRKFCKKLKVKPSLRVLYDCVPEVYKP